MRFGLSWTTIAARSRCASACSGGSDSQTWKDCLVACEKSNPDAAEASGDKSGNVGGDGSHLVAVMNMVAYLNVGDAANAARWAVYAVEIGATTVANIMRSVNAGYSPAFAAEFQQDIARLTAPSGAGASKTTESNALAYVLIAGAAYWYFTQKKG